MTWCFPKPISVAAFKDIDIWPLLLIWNFIVFPNFPGKFRLQSLDEFPFFHSSSCTMFQNLQIFHAAIFSFGSFLCSFPEWLLWEASQQLHTTFHFQKFRQSIEPIWSSCISAFASFSGGVDSMFTLGKALFRTIEPSGPIRWKLSCGGCSLFRFRSPLVDYSWLPG